MKEWQYLTIQDKPTYMLLAIELGIFNKKHEYEDEQAVTNMLASTDLGYLTLKRQQGGQNIILVDGTGYKKKPEVCRVRPGSPRHTMRQCLPVKIRWEEHGGTTIIGDRRTYMLLGRELGIWTRNMNMKMNKQWWTCLLLQIWDNSH